METTFLLRIDSELKKEAEDVAKKSDRSLNGHILNLIKKDLFNSKSSDKIVPERDIFNPIV